MYKKTKLRKQIMQCLNNADHAIPSSKIAVEIGHPNPYALTQRLRILVNAGMIEQLGRGKFYYLITDKGRAKFGFTNSWCGIRIH